MKVSFGNNPTQNEAPAGAASPAVAGAASVAPVIDVQAEVVKAPEAVNTTPATDIPTAPVTNAVAVVPPALVARPADNPFSYNDEDIGFGDIILPAINIVQKVGELSNIFTPGEIVLNQSIVIHEPANKERQKAGHPPLLFTVLGFRPRRYVEKKAGGQQGHLFNTEAEVVAAGGTLDYKEAKSTNKPLYQTLSTALILLQKPEHLADEDHLNFPNECEGKWYALALWSMKGTAFTNAAKVIFTARRLGHLKTTGYPAQAWSLTTKLEGYSGDTFAHIPVIKPGPKNTEKFAELVREVLGAGR